ncbi:chitosanase [Marchantia polymorpha subsp. ruderalis]|uniref:Chitosanase n=2 Tax=Marchantia polymorpha TaxID=3197 RepID=A0AAF6B916_MARPO|nr:hypothetical protein MARPO_0011s0191 [Marchantia polymorpha]BBN08500.1 hypothetical protein Mp_4g12090 [Marchantia polymorpha subsp. ruderalis]|eukprot:PTQ46534.1 hypothetical protein MARPO_0011s0191 [Marchantia polymorpha]
MYDTVREEYVHKDIPTGLSGDYDIVRRRNDTDHAEEHRDSQTFSDKSSGPDRRLQVMPSSNSDSVHLWASVLCTTVAVESLEHSGPHTPQFHLASRPVGSNKMAHDLSNPAKKVIAMKLVSSAENSSLDWDKQYSYIEDIGDGRGYTGGLIGFTSCTGDMLELVELYVNREPGNVLAKYLPALRAAVGSDTHRDLGDGFVRDWKKAAKKSPVFKKCQDDELDRVCFDPAVKKGRKDGLRALGQFIYYDALVMHGPGRDPKSFGGIRKSALSSQRTPSQGGDERAYLEAFLNARVVAMKAETAHKDVSRVENAQRVFLRDNNFDLATPLRWSVYGDQYAIP